MKMSSRGQHRSTTPTRPYKAGFAKRSARQNKRRKLDSSQEDDNASHESASEDESEGNNSSLADNDSLADSSSEVEHSGSEEHEEAAKPKKSKYKIHIPKECGVPEKIVEYGTQLPDGPDSSPYRIRGPRWKIPKDSGVEDRKQIPRLEVQVNELSVPDPEITEGHRQGLSAAEITRELADLPSDAFSSSEPESPPRTIHHTQNTTQVQSRRPVASLNGFRQTTLFGGRATHNEPVPSQANKTRNYRADKAPELPTHHKLDSEALKTWVYPTNLGAIRDYQYSIVKNGLFNNLLVALPTGLGKTFIAATVMLNYFRWTNDAKIVFVAPTKPLVAQQVDACFNIVGIPRSTTTLLTGETSPALRAEEWEEKRVFFMTPQTLENDLSSGIADPKKIVLLVVDEAHRATGNYAYVKVVKFLRRFNTSFRVLALTATPGASVEAVQEVIDGLEISKVEIRTEDSIDIQQFIHQRKIDQILLDPSEEIVMIKELYAKALQPLVDLLCGQNAYYNRDPMTLTPFGMLQAQKKWFMDAGRRASPGLRGMMTGLFSILASVAHGIKLLNYHGIGPFWDNVKQFRADVEERGEKGSKYKKQIIENASFRKMMDRIQLWINHDGFIGHPKLTYLCDTILNHFMDAGEGTAAQGSYSSNTRVIVFTEFRDSAEEIARVLKRHAPMVRPSVFVGQADSKRSEGMNQAKQQETINKFKSGNFNVLVATSIGEEGLDIGQVDLIVCYDASGSPIRMLQRMGRTGRKRAGNIVLLLMRGKEEESFQKAKDNYEHMQKLISSGDRFNFRHDLSVRIVPLDVNPTVEKRMIEIPIENTQTNALPEPKRRAGRAKKKPPKKFHMPDGVITGFLQASKLGNASDKPQKISSKRVINDELSEESLEPLPTPGGYILDTEDETEFQQMRLAAPRSNDYLTLALNTQFGSQRRLSRTKIVAHGSNTTRFHSTISSMQKVSHEISTSTTHDLQRKQLLHRQNELVSFSYEQPWEFEPQSSKGSPLPASKRYPSSLSDEDRDSDLTITQGVRFGDDDENESDLQDFIVKDGGKLRRSSMPLSISSSPATLPQMQPAVEPRFYEPTRFTNTQESQDDFQDLEDLVGNRTRTPLADKDSSRNIPTHKGGRGKRRRVVETDDSDD